jgi:DeoR family transcriptional regulator of aga operon/DeoR family fructose operon transcriptional repressor
MQHERRNDIVAKIRKDRIIKITDLKREYRVSTETIRRDLEYLERNGQLRRVYGGAVLNGLYGIEEQYEHREHINYFQKRAIGKKAAEFISDGDTLFIDNGTTVMELVKNLGHKKNLTVITNGTLIAQTLDTVNHDCRIILLGGELRRNELTVSGAITEAALNNFYAARAVIGIGGIDSAAGITDYNFHDANTRRIMIERANMVIGLADYSKFGVITMNYICPAVKLNVLVTDWTTPEEILAEYRAMGIEVCAVPETGI